MNLSKSITGTGHCIDGGFVEQHFRLTILLYPYYNYNNITESW